MQKHDSSIHSSTSSYDESVVNSIIFPDESAISYKTVLYEELRLIERNESEINVCWKGAHMMLFFMSFVFGSMCTCCIHRLKFMFGDECVLFPKLVTHSTVHSMVYEFFSFKTEKQNIEPQILPVELVATKWSENSVCYLPTYVPLVSGLSGLVWTTMFLMCSSGTTHNVTGAQRHWRALPIMFLFCAVMAGLCIYTSTITHNGLKDLCSKLAHATGSQKCGYNINVATLAFDRRIRGVYQATLLSIASAWLHTICWLLSTLLIVARVLLAVDFTLVHVTAHLVGNVEDILQKYEKQMNSLNAESAKPYKSDIDEEDSEVELYTTTNTANETQIQGLLPSGTGINELNGQLPQQSDSVISLVPEMTRRLIEIHIREVVYKLLRNIGKPDPRSSSIPHGEATTSAHKNIKLVTNSNKKSFSDTEKSVSNTENIKKIAKDITQKLNEKLTQEFNDFEHQININLKNTSINRDTEITSNFEEPGDKRNNSNITDKLEHKTIEQENSLGLPKERDNNDKDIQMKRSHTVQFYDDKLTQERKREGKIDEKKQNKSEDIDKSRRSGELRISDDLNDDDIQHPENTITTKDQKQGEKKDEQNEQTKADDKANLVEVVNYISSMIQQVINSLVPANEKNYKAHKQGDEKVEQKEQNKSENEGKPRISGELHIFDDSNDRGSVPDGKKQNKSEDIDKSRRIGELQISDDLNDDDIPVPESTITTKDQKQGEKKNEQSEQTKADDKANLVEVVNYISSMIQQIINSLVPANEKMDKAHKQGDEKVEQKEQNKSENEGKPRISGELHIFDDSNDSGSVPEDKKTKDQEQSEKK